MTIRAILFVLAGSHRSATALANLRDHMSRTDLDLELEVVDITEWPDLADEHRILAAPTLVVREPAVGRRLIGDMRDRAELYRVLNIEQDPFEREAG